MENYILGKNGCSKQTKKFIQRKIMSNGHRNVVTIGFIKQKKGNKRHDEKIDNSKRPSETI
mgnify:FL=1